MDTTYASPGDECDNADCGPVEVLPQHPELGSRSSACWPTCSKSGNNNPVTIMCAMTQFPEAIPLCKITAPAVVRTFYVWVAEGYSN